MSLPVPDDPDFTVPDLGEDAFFNPLGQEDDALLATGAWGEEEVPPVTRPRVRVHIHRDR